MGRKPDGPYPPYSVTESEHGPFYPHFWVVDDHVQQIEGPFLDRLTAEFRAEELTVAAEKEATRALWRLLK